MPLAEPLAPESEAIERFAFGDNWRRFLSHLTPERVACAEQSLRTMLGRDSLAGLRFLDVGSGSGLFSLAARRLGAEVVSFDYDADSVSCTREIRERRYPGDPLWRVEQGSILDRRFVGGLGRFDVVYAWGVLHHTGAMWSAIENTLRTLAPTGTLVLALYNDQGWISRYWHSVKRMYYRGGVARVAMLALHVPYLVGARRVVRRLSGRERLDRGMSYWYDMRDWLGGLPFEVASRERVSMYMAARGLELVRLTSCGNRHGCNEFVFRYRDDARTARGRRAVAPSSKPRRILFFTRSLGYGGAERQLTLLARGLHDAGHEVSVATLYGGGPFQQDLAESGVPVHVLGKRGRWDVSGFSRALLALVRTLEPEIIHSYLVVPNIAAAALRMAGTKSKIVWGVRASSVQWDKYEWGFRASFELSRVASRGAHLIIANSEAGRRFHARMGYPSNRMVVVPNGIDAEHFAPRPHARAAMRRQWGIDAAAPVVGMVGRLDPMKGHDRFLQAAALLRDRVPEARFLVIGDGPAHYASQLRQLAESLGIADRVHWIDAHNDVRDCYAALDVLVSLSLWGEGFPNVVAEAMATGTPCVVTGCGDSEIVVGDTGAVLPSADPDVAAKGIEQLLMIDSSRRAELGRRARERIIDQFSIERLVANTEAALAPLLATR